MYKSVYRKYCDRACAIIQRPDSHKYNINYYTKSYNNDHNNNDTRTRNNGHSSIYKRAMCREIWRLQLDFCGNNKDGANSGPKGNYR